MILDDQRPLVPKWAREVFSDERALKYVDGIGIHWYADEIFVVPFALDQAHEEFPDKFLLYTEGPSMCFHLNFILNFIRILSEFYLTLKKKFKQNWKSG